MCGGRVGEGETEPRISSEYGIQGNKHSGGGAVE